VAAEGITGFEKALAEFAVFLASPWVPLMTHDEKPPAPIEIPKGRHWVDPLSQIRRFADGAWWPEGPGGRAQDDSRWDPIGEFAAAPAPTFAEQDNPQWDPLHVAIAMSRESKEMIAREPLPDVRWDPIGTAATAPAPTRKTVGLVPWDPLGQLHKVSVPRSRAKFDPAAGLLRTIERPRSSSLWDPLSQLKRVESFAEQQADDPLAGLSRLDPPKKNFGFDPMQVGLPSLISMFPMCFEMRMKHGFNVTKMDSAKPRRSADNLACSAVVA
jgi:hypothetical protein